MARTTGAGDLEHPTGQAVAAVTLVTLLVGLVALASSVGAAAITLGLVTLAAAGYLGLRRYVRLPHIASRPVAVAVLGAGLAIAAFGSTLAPHATQTTASEGVAPSTTTPAPVARPAAPAAATAAPRFVMTCPIGGSVDTPLFSEDITATAPYTVSIDYGDGDRYTDDHRHLGAIFTHTYRTGGSFTVSAVLTDATGQTASASCMYTWAQR
jgi:hypothetical protein